MTFDAAIQFLLGLQTFGLRPGLGRARRLAALAGNPQERLRFIHVAGTNGKGSTCAMLEGIFRAAGLRTGLFTSPHLVSFTERLQVNRRPIAPRDLARLTGELRPWLKSFSAKNHPTLFEAVTVMALRYFVEQECDLVLWETGLGGRLDATNIVTPLASVITNIDFDHQQWLGDTLDEIAAEKAGILKPGVPAITAAQPGRGLEVIAARARELRVPLRVVTVADTRKAPLSRLPMPLSGAHQRLNAAVALAVVDCLQPVLPVPSAAIVRGLRRVRWPGRLQRVTRRDGRSVVLDGAHNTAGAAALAAFVKKAYAGCCVALLLGVLEDKDWQEMARLLAPLARRILVVPVRSDRSLAAMELARACQSANPRATVETFASLAAALAAARREPRLVITGSLYLVGEAMEKLRLTPAPASHERTLNEWGKRRSA
jgi:dihydrofolate synthase/folylpolyglutamate synthase